MNDDCLFCEIAGHHVDAEIVIETDEVRAFRDINAVASTHVLVIPKRHIVSASELGSQDADLMAHMFQVMAQIARDEGLDRGHRIVTNVGAEGGQTVDHLHFHLIGGRPMTWPPG